MVKKVYGWQTVDPNDVTLDRVMVSCSTLERLEIDADTGRICDRYHDLPVGVWWRDFQTAKKELVKIMRARAASYKLAAEQAKQLLLESVGTIEY